MKTLFEKVWEQHVVAERKGEPTLLYIDLQLLHEVTSPQAFEGLRLANRKVRRPDRCIATVDHNVPTTIEGRLNIVDQIAATQIATLRKNCAEFGIELYDVNSREQGIVHIIGPELGITKPGMTIVCGDSHTSTHGAFGALAFGIGTSEVEHVLATQTLPQAKPGTMAVTVDGDLPRGVTAKDIVLAIINRIGTGGGIGAGARAGLGAPDDTTFAYLEGREHAPAGAAWEQALDDWRELATDDGATFDEEVALDAAAWRPSVTWGTTPAQSVFIDDAVPSPDSFADADARDSAARALRYMGLQAG